MGYLAKHSGLEESALVMLVCAHGEACHAHQIPPVPH